MTTSGMNKDHSHPGCEYRLDRWVRWPEEVHAFVEDFHERFGVFPNALVASPSTFARMDIAADPDHVRGQDGGRPSEAEYTVLGGMASPDYELTFLLNDAIIDRGVLLVREGSDSDGDGEPVHELETTQVRATA